MSCALNLHDAVRGVRGCTTVVAALVCLAVGASNVHAQISGTDSSAIVATTRRLLDAITNGDSSVWAPHLAPPWFITDEEGRHLARAEFLRELRPLPTGQQGKLELTSWHLVSVGTTAVMSYLISEEHDYYGIPLRTRFHSTDTWARIGSGWKILASQVVALPTPVPGRAVDRRLLGEYAGTYRLAADSARSGGLELTIDLGNDGLTVRRGNRPPERLYALDERIFIRHGVRGFWVFERDSSGAVTEVVNWRDNNPLVWRRR